MNFFLAKLSLQFQIKVNLYLTSNLHVIRTPFVFTVVLQPSGIALSSSACKKLSSHAMLCFLGVCCGFFSARQFLQSDFVYCPHTKQSEGHRLGLCHLSRSFCNWIHVAAFFFMFLLLLTPAHLLSVHQPVVPFSRPLTVWHLGLISFWILQILHSGFKWPPGSLYLRFPAPAPTATSNSFNAPTPRINPALSNPFLRARFCWYLLGASHLLEVPSYCICAA